MPDRSSGSTLEWLMESDPAIRWQAERDLLGASRRAVVRERERVATEGWGAKLLALQEPNGRWGGGLYTPKWTSTVYTMLLLRDFGLPSDNEQAHKACRLLLEQGVRQDGGVGFDPKGRSETCISGMTLSIFAYCEQTDERVDALVDHLLERQMPDGGWNCRLPRGATHASVHTTISVLEGLRFYELYRGRKTRALRAAQSRAREFLLAHRFFRSHRTGNVINSAFKQFVFPPRWHYDVLRALDYFQSVGADRDERAAEAIALVRAKRDADGRWPLENAFRGPVHFTLERVGAPSRWNTLRALRVLKWWEQA